MTQKPYPKDTLWGYSAAPFMASVGWLAALTLVVCFGYLFLDASIAWLLWGQMGLLVLMLFVGGPTFGQRMVALGFVVFFSFIQWIFVLFWAIGRARELAAG
tara:strand:+ start:361 stop:666 length:306 start_codon:yes stop_codon:yes gene_type:complete